MIRGHVTRYQAADCLLRYSARSHFALTTRFSGNPFMAYTSLREFIDRLEKHDRLKRVSAPVSPNLEMTEIQTRLLAEQGPAAV